MGISRPCQDIQYANRILGKWVQELSRDRRLARRFMAFVEYRLGTPIDKIRPRLYHIKQGRVPTTAVALAMIEFFGGVVFETSTVPGAQDCVTDYYSNIMTLTPEQLRRAMEIQKEAQNLLCRLGRVLKSTPGPANPCESEVTCDPKI